MKRLILLLLMTSGLLISGCGSGDEGHTNGDGADHSHEQPAGQTDQEHTHGQGEDQHQHAQENVSQSSTVQRQGSGAVTQWTDETELFMEYPEIVVGREATFAVHLTRLSDFAPIANSEVYFTFRSDNGAEITVRETEVQVPGIYGPDVTFDQAGRYDLTIEIYGMVNDTMQVNGIPVYNSADEIQQAQAGEDPNLITFLKEQQWDIPFGTREVTHRTLTRTVEAHGEIQPVQSNQAIIAAPFSGILLSSMNRNLPVVGQQVSRGATLVTLNPAVQSSDGENYAQQFINAQSQLELASKNLERSKRLFQKEAIPELELEKARIEYRQALIRFQTINEIIQIDTSAIDSYGTTEESYRFDLKSPINGTIVESHITPGMQVKVGDPLFKVAELSKVWLKAHLPASERASVGTPGAASFTIQGSDRLYELSELSGRLVSIGNSVDPATRTFPVIYELSNPGSSFQSGLFANVHIDTETKQEVLAIPETALIEEEGNFVVYVHVSGESFEKRRITTGIRDRGWVEVTSGLVEGEYVVTINAYQVKLASLSTEAPAHGHSH